MILVDYSSSLHRKLYTSIKKSNPTKDENGKFITSEYIQLFKNLVLDDILEIRMNYSNKYGDIVLCMDNKDDIYWRKKYYSEYKMGRVKLKENSEINFDEFYQEANKLEFMFNNYTDIKCVTVKECEADDLILVLAKQFAPLEDILIYSPDKDFIQSQRHYNNIDQYSKLTDKWIKADTKSGNMDEWIIEHVCLGDIADNIPKITDNTVFSDNFLEYLKSHDICYTSPVDFYLNIQNDVLEKLIINFDVYKKNKNGEDTEKDIYNNPRFGQSTLHKKIKEFGSLDKFLDSNPLYRNNYNRNFKLVMDDGIPQYLQDEIIKKYHEAEQNYDIIKLNEFFEENRLSKTFDKDLLFNDYMINSTKEITAEDFGW